MELHELQVGDSRSRAQGHGDAVAGGAGRVGRVRVEAARATRREDHGVGAEPGGNPVMQHADAAHGALDHDQLGEQSVLDRGDRVVRRTAAISAEEIAAPVASPPACTIRACRWGPPRVRAATAPSARPIEPDAAGDQLRDPLGALGHQQVDSRGIREPGTGVDRVGGMLLRRVVGPVDARDASLGEAGRPVPERSLGDERHRVSGLVRVECRRETGDARADDQDVHRVLALTGGFAASIRSSATRAGSATSPVTVILFGVRPATSSSSTQAR